MSGILIEGTWIAERILGHVEDIRKAQPGVYYAVISYLPEAVESDFTEFLNMLFGNVSLLPGIRLMSIELPEAMESTFNGPKFGQTGLRELCGVPRGPILMSAVKPLGRSAEELARMAGELALGGCPIIKDDHSLFDQRWAPFADRVRAMADAVHDANAQTGGHSSTWQTAPPTASISSNGPIRRRNSAPTASWPRRASWDSAW